MNGQIDELKTSLNNIQNEILSLDDDNFHIRALNINNRVKFFKNYKEKVRKETDEGTFRLIETELLQITKLINISFDNIIKRITNESKEILVEIRKTEKMKKINNYRSYDER
jgi:hypothetical protein